MKVDQLFSFLKPSVVDGAENKQDIMGCGPQAKPPTLQRADTLIGILKVVVIDANFPLEAELEHPTIKLRVSNQQFSTSDLALLNKDHKVNEAFTFTINSFHKADGRAIEAGVFDGKKFIAYGAVDANPIINGRGQVNEFRVILASDKEKKFGFTTLQATFTQLPATELTFRFQTATIRHKKGGKVGVRLTIGQEELQTEFQEDVLESPPIWKDQMLNFKVPQGITTGLLELINGNGQEIGSSIIDLTTMLQSKPGDEVFVAQELFFKQEEKNIDAANLKYSYIVGQNASFSHLQDVLRSSVRGVRSRNEFDQPILERPK